MPSLKWLHLTRDDVWPAILDVLSIGSVDVACFTRLSVTGRQSIWAVLKTVAWAKVDLNFMV